MEQLNVNIFGGSQTENLTHVSKISLETGLKSIENFSFTKVPRLILLHLKNNQITTLAANAFNGLTILKYLLLQYNNITVLPENIFETLAGLFYLDLSFNMLTSFEFTLLKNNGGLYVLALDNNPITSFRSNVTVTFSMKKLQNLYLQKTETKKICLDDLPAMPFLKQLNIDNRHFDIKNISNNRQALPILNTYKKNNTNDRYSLICEKRDPIQDKMEEEFLEAYKVEIDKIIFRKNADHEQIKNELETNLTASQQEIDRLKSSNKNLKLQQAQKKELESENTNLKKRIEEIQSKVNQTIEEHETVKKNHTLEMERLEMEQIELTNEYDKLQSQTNELQNKLSNTIVDHIASKMQNQELKSNHTQLQLQINETIIEIKTLKENRAVKIDENKVLASKYNQVEKELNKMINETMQLSKHTAELQLQVNDTIIENSILNIQLNLVNGEYGKLQLKLNNTITNNKQQKIYTEKLQSNNTQLKIDLNKTKVEYEILNEKIDETLKLYSNRNGTDDGTLSLTDKVVKTVELIETSKLEIDSLNITLTSQNRENEKLQLKVSEINQEKQNMETTNKELIQRLQNQHDEIAQVESKQNNTKYENQNLTMQIEKTLKMTKNYKVENHRMKNTLADQKLHFTEEKEQLNINCQVRINNTIIEAQKLKNNTKLEVLSKQTNIIQQLKLTGIVDSVSELLCYIIGCILFVVLILSLLIIYKINID
jgi:hypothetical protein